MNGLINFNVIIQFYLMSVIRENESFEERTQIIFTAIALFNGQQELVSV